MKCVRGRWKEKERDEVVERRTSQVMSAKPDAINLPFNGASV